MATPAINIPEVLAPFGLTSASDPTRVFDSPIIRAASLIRTTYPLAAYDHRPTAPEWDRQFPFLESEEFRRGYAAFKWTVARVLAPRTIVEIGVGAGTAARAFLDAAPAAHYHGIDDGSKDRTDSVRLIDYTRERMERLGQSHSFTIVDSMTLTSAPRADLFHVDGAHDFQHALNDCRLAVASGSEWILVDDSRDPEVAAAAHMAVYGIGGAVFEWTHFEDTWTGSILIHRRQG